MLKLEINNLTELASFVTNFSKIIEPNMLIYLEGNLGSGKTSFVQLLFKQFGYEKSVTSPTFTLINHYQIAGYNFYHCDFYRLSSSAELFNLSVEDLIKDSVVLVEWPALLKQVISDDYININFELQPNNQRRIIVTATDRWKTKIL